MDIFLARQPIFSRERVVEGYELLYREGEGNAFQGKTDGSAATRAVISESLLDFGLDSLTGGKRAFVNFTEELLLAGATLMLDPELFVVEILEDVRFTPQIVESLRELKRKGYTLALDDYVGGDVPEEALNLIDVVKIDFMLTNPLTRLKMSRRLGRGKKVLLAEKLETGEDFQEALDLGCELFQGYYFARPAILKKSRRDIATSTYNRLSRIAAAGEIDVEQLEETVRSDAYLAHKLMKRINSMRFYRGHSVDNVRHALVRLGNNEVRRWMMLVLARNVVDGESDGAVRMGLIRAVLCENIAKSTGHPEARSGAFDAGLFSIFDPSDPEYPELMDDLGLSDECRAALSGGDNLPGLFLRVTECYERGEWKQLDELMKKLPVDGLPQMYVRAVSYADMVLSD